MKRAIIFIFLLNFTLTYAQLNNKEIIYCDSLEQIVKGEFHDSTKIKAMYAWDDVIYVAYPKLDFKLNNDMKIMCHKNLITPDEDSLFYKGYLRNAYNNLGVIYRSYGDYDSAMFCHEEALGLAFSLNNKLGIANAFGNMSILFMDKSDYTQSIDLAMKALEIHEEINNTVAIGQVNNNLGVLHLEKGEFEKAFEYYKKALEIYYQINHQMGVADCKNNLANIMRFWGRFEEAEIYFLESKEIYVANNSSAGVARTMANIGSIYSDKGEIEKSIEYNLEASKISNEIGDKKALALSLNSIGINYRDLGDYESALSHHKSAYKIYNELGEQFGSAQGLDNLGADYFLLEDYDSALYCFQESLKIYTEIDAKEGMGTSNGNLAHVLLLLEKYDESIKKYMQSFKLYEEIDYPKEVANAKNNLGAAIYQKALNDSLGGGFNKKLPEYHLAKSYCNSAYSMADTLGVSSIKRDALRNLYLISLTTSEIDSADYYLNKLLEIRNKDLEINFVLLPDKHKTSYFKTIEPDFAFQYNFTLNYDSIVGGCSERAYNYALLTKGILLRSSIAMRNSILNSGDSILVELYNSWIAINRQISRVGTEGGNIKELEETAIILEKELVENSTSFHDLTKSKSVKWKDIQSQLNSEDVAIEFVRYRENITGQQDTFSYSYGAILIRPDWTQPRIIRLCSENELVRLIGYFQGNNQKYISDLYGTKNLLNHQLFSLLWEPIEPYLTNVKTAYYSPVGLLHKLSFQAFSNTANELLIEKYNMSLLSSTGSLIEKKAPFKLNPSKVMLMGGINFSSEKNEKEVWSYLSGTKKEIDQIEKILKIKNGKGYYSDLDATEEIFKTFAQDYQIIHLATHGFFYNDPDEIEENLERDINSNIDITFRGGNMKSANHIVNSNNPLVRSGLVMAKANDVWNLDSIQGEDGILTAQEVSILNLDKTELVVLSACETGLGDIYGSEGVYGLQRSFKMSGVPYLIMSLWEVPDEETSEFMTLFYKLLSKSISIQEAFRTTQYKMSQKYGPYFWAAFVLVE